MELYVVPIVYCSRFISYTHMKKKDKRGKLTIYLYANVNKSLFFLYTLDYMKHGLRETFNNYNADKQQTLIICYAILVRVNIRSKHFLF